MKKGATFMSILIKEYIVHVMDSTIDMPILSDSLDCGNQQFEEYLTKTIEKSFYSDDIKTCFLNPNSNVHQLYQNNHLDLKTISSAFAKEIFFIMHRNVEIPKADCVFGIADIRGEQFLFMLKLDHKALFTHYVETNDNKPTVRIISNTSLFPALPPKVSEGFFISINSPVVKVLEEKYLVDGIKDHYLSTQILQCAENASPRQKATRLLRVAEKVANLYYSEEDNMEQHISSTVYNELQTEESLSVKSLGAKFFVSNPIAQKEFFERLSTFDISEDETLSLSEKFQKKFQKQAIKSKSGIEVKIPTQLYSDENEVEFINNPDGTISLLIKNITI